MNQNSEPKEAKILCKAAELSSYNASVESNEL